MRRFGLLVAALVVTGGAAEAQSLATVTSKGFGVPTVTPALVECTDVPTTSEPVSALRLLAGHSPDRHESFSAGEEVVLTVSGLTPGHQYFIRRAQRGRDGQPISDRSPGAIQTAGWLTISASDENFSLARIDYACDAPRIGDYLEPYQPRSVPDAVTDNGAPDFAKPIWVLFGKDRREEFGVGDVLSMEAGAASGLAEGTRIAFYRDRRYDRWRSHGDLMPLVPLVYVGDGHVVQVLPNTAKVLLTRSNDVITKGDLAYVRGAQ